MDQADTKGGTVVIVIMQGRATEEEIQKVTGRLERAGFGIHLSQGVEKTIIGAIGKQAPEMMRAIEAMDGVERVVPILRPFKLVSREFRQEDTLVRVGDRQIGGGRLAVIAGPCAVESREQLLEAADAVRAGGGHLLRGGAFKPRTSPYSFQGLEEAGLQLLAEAREKTGLPIVTEVITPGDVTLVAAYADMLQIGARNMQNFPLLKEVGRQRKPVLLKRALSATIEEWLMAAEYIAAAGNNDIVLCERGIRTYETYTRNTLDLSAVAVVKSLSHLPVMVDPSHALGRWEFVPAMSMAAVAAGADGLLIEVHPHPQEALCDGPQSLTPKRFGQLMARLQALEEVLNRTPAAERAAL